MEIPVDATARQSGRTPAPSSGDDKPRLVHRVSSVATSLMQRFLSARAHAVSIGEGECRFADGLTGFMSLARDEETVILGEHRNRPPDRLSPVANLFDIVKTARPPSMALRIDAGSSERGLSSVTMT